MNKASSFTPFLERLQQQSEVPGDRLRQATPASLGASATQRILQALQGKNAVDPSDLLTSGVDFVEMGRAVERLRSLDGIVMAEVNGRQVLQRGPKFEEVLSLLSLS